LGFATGMLLALITLRMNELVAGLTTLAFGETMVIIAFNIEYIGGANGFIGIPLETTVGLVYLVLASVVFAAWRFDRSRLGYAARACRDNAGAAAAMGINITWVKTLVFALGSAIAGVGGVLRAHYVLVQNPDDMGFFFVPLRITHPRKLAGEHRVIIVSGMLGQATPPTRDADADPLGQASAARTCLAASGHRHGIICLRLGQATKRIRR